MFITNFTGVATFKLKMQHIFPVSINFLIDINAKMWEILGKKVNNFSKKHRNYPEISVTEIVRPCQEYLATRVP